MNKPNIDIPSGFAENGTKEDFPNDKILNGFDPINPDILPGDCLNKFIDDTYKASNYALDLGDYVLGHNQIANCILEAPNGVATYSGSTITLKAGLKVLIPNGLNTDGTLNNIEYTLENDVSRIISDNGKVYVFSKIDNTISIMPAKATLFLDSLNTTLTKTRQYINNENKWYTIDSNGNATVEPMTFVGVMDFSNSIITKFTSFNTVNLLKQNDKVQISGWGMPSDKYIALTLGASGTTYTAPANGWVNIIKKSSAANQYLNMRNMKHNFTFCGSTTAYNNGVECWSILPVSKGDIFRIDYTTGGQTFQFNFIYAVGSESEAS